MKKYISFGTLGFIVLAATLLLCAVYFIMFVYADLSDETLEIVDGLRWKHSFGTLISLTDCSDVIHYDSDIEYDWQSIWFEDGKLIVSTNKGKWFVEMEKMEE